jgi:hypothetical protein
MGRLHICKTRHQIPAYTLKTMDNRQLDILLKMIEEIESHGEGECRPVACYPPCETTPNWMEVKKELLERYRCLREAEEKRLTAYHHFFHYFHPLRVPVKRYFNRLKKRSREELLPALSKNKGNHLTR